jgi:8-oxo-dGTP pyrophosphatase MutT (NUDIX family)
MGSENETVIIVDNHNRVVDTKPRSVMRQMNLPHRATYVLVFDKYQRLFVHKRTQNKDIFPGYFDIAAGGVVVKGETYRQSAERELFEELGIRNVPLDHLFEFHYNDSLCDIWGRVFKCEYDGIITLQAEEIESGQFMKI